MFILNKKNLLLQGISDCFQLMNNQQYLKIISTDPSPDKKVAFLLSI